MALWHRIDPDVKGAKHLENAPGQAPARLLIGGHQNGLADPILACIALQPQLHFFTRADAFRHWLSRWMMIRLHMMPVFRPVDRVDNLAERNMATFSSAYARLEQGAICGIFPEAGHLDERRIRRFRHGSARFIAGALQRKRIRDRGFEVLPMHLDFERYEGYRTAARVRIGEAIPCDDIPGIGADSGAARVALSQRMRDALMACSVNLEGGEMYNPHLAVCRFLEGAMGGPVPHHTLAAAAVLLKTDPASVKAAFEAALKCGWGHPRLNDDFAAAGRWAANKPTSLAPLMWRLPAWLIFMLTTGWWPRVAEKAAQHSVKDVAFRTTLSIPLTMVGVSLTWAVLSLGAGVIYENLAAVPAVFLLLRGAQYLAMPLEDAFIDARAERRIRPLMSAPFIQKWCTTLLARN